MLIGGAPRRSDPRRETLVHPVGGRSPDKDPVALANPAPAELGVTRRGQQVVRKGSRPAQDFLHRRAHKRRVGPQPLALFVVLN